MEELLKNIMSNYHEEKEEIWRKLERLSVYYINSVMFKKNLTQDMALELTIRRHDGGFDGLWNKNNNIYLLESKYRSNSVSLNDCAKAIIIALNYPADYLYLSTNKYFMPQAVDNIRKIKRKRNLDIYCIEGAKLARFVQSYRKDLDEKFDKEFLDLVEEYSDETVNINDNVGPNEFDCSLGVHISGTRHKEYIEYIHAHLFTHTNALLVSGQYGTGKSSVIKEASKRLIQDGYRSEYLDLSQIVSPRMLFIHVLQCIWGVDLTVLLKATDPNEIIDVLNIEAFHFEIDLLRSIAYALTDSEEKLNDLQDKYFQYLVNYISLVAHGKYRKLLIVFENIHSSNAEVVSFFVSIITALSHNGIKIIIECRTPFLMKYQHGNKVSYLKYHCLEEKCDDSLEIHDFQNDFAVGYIFDSLSGKLEKEKCTILAQLLLYKPLEINTALMLLKKNDNDFFFRLNNQSVVQTRDFFSRQNYTQTGVRLKMINLLRAEQKINSCFFELALLFNGKIPLTILEKLFEENAWGNWEDTEAAKIFQTVKSEPVVECHLEYLSAMEQSRDLSAAFQVAKTLYSFDKTNYSPSVYLNILYMYGKKREIPTHLIGFIKRLKSENVYSQIVYEIRRYISNIMDIDASFRTSLLLEEFAALKELHKQNERRYEEDWDMLSREMIFLPENSIPKIRYLLLSWDRYFTKGDFPSAMEIISPLYESISLTPQDMENDYIGQIVNAYGLTIKETDSGIAAYNLFKKNYEIYPKSFYIRYALASQDGNSRLKSAPLTAIPYFEKILEIGKSHSFSYQQILHARADIAMCKTLGYIKSDIAHTKGELEKIIYYIDECFNIAEQRGINIQMGRLLTFKGILYICEEQYKKAYYYVEQARKYLIEADASIYFWRAEFCLLSLELHHDSVKMDKVCTFLRNITKILTKSFLSKVRQDKDSASGLILLACCKYYRQIGLSEEAEKIIEMVNCDFFRENYELLTDDKACEKIFKGKVMPIHSVLIAVG